jgi:Helicase associated domain
LGRWVSIQRHEYKAGKLTDEKKRRLQEMGFQWDARRKREEGRKCHLQELGFLRKKRRLKRLKQPCDDKKSKMTQEARWSLKFGELQSYYNTHGDCNVPTVGGVRWRSYCWIKRVRNRLLFTVFLTALCFVESA